MTVAVVIKNIEQSRNSREDQLVHASHLLREHVDRIFGNVEWIMETASNAFLASPDDRGKLEGLLIALGQREEFAFYVTLTGVDGVSIASSLRTSGVDLKDREHVSALMAPDAPDTFVGEARRGPRSGLLAINISRKIIDEKGEWRGIIIVAFDPSRVAEFWRGLSINKSVTGMLIRSDGVVLARSGISPRSEQREVIGGIGEALEREWDGIIRRAVLVDGKERLFAFRQLTRLPLIVAVGIDHALFDRERSEWLLLSLLWMTLLGAALVGLGFLIRKFILAEEARQASHLAEADRIRTAELIQASFNNAGVFVIVFDNQRRVRFANRPAADVIQRLAAPVGDMLAKLAEGERGGAGTASPTTSHWLHLRDGSMRTICWSIAAAEWIGPDCLVAIGFDRTEAEHIERMLSHKARLTSLGEVAVGIAHEVAQPLTIINFTAQRMVRSLEAGEASLEGLSTIRSAATRAGRILTQIKTFARQHDQAEDAVFDVAECVEAIETLTRRQLEHRRICLQVCSPAEPSFARGDPHMLEQILLNLVLNARDALTDHATPGGERRIRIEWQSGKGVVRICVRDNGPGIAGALQDRIFEPFFTTKKGGTGLGLSLSFSMAQQMGGSLSLDLSPHGAAFVVDLLAAEATLEEGPATHEAIVG